MIKRPKLVKDWKGGYVRSLQPVSTTLGTIPAGTIYQVISAGIKAEFLSLPCKCCGMQQRYTDKSKSKFDQLEWLGYELPTKQSPDKDVSIPMSSLNVQDCY